MYVGDGRKDAYTCTYMYILVYSLGYTCFYTSPISNWVHPKPLRADLVGYVDMYIYHWLIIHVHVELKLHVHAKLDSTC